MGERPETKPTACPECGTSFVAGAKYCANCGYSLSGFDERSRSEPLPSGSVVGSYRLLDVLGEGGMGRVYVGEHIKLGRRVAVKMLRPEFATNPAAVSRFFAEARAVNRISHENIVEITDFLEKPGGDNCYIMELLRGEDLGRRLIQTKFLPIEMVVDIGAQIASALAAVHEAGIIHRDLKPDNIFITERRGRPNFVKLLDFGVAKLSGGGAPIDTHRTGVGQIIGTPEYMSPEQAGGQPVDHRADIYALGIILYELVTGTVPFRAKSFGELVIKHMTVPPKRPSLHSGLPHEIPAELELLILDLLAKEADHRPQSMHEVEQRLHEIIEAMDIPVPRSWLPSGTMKIPAVARSGAFPRVASEADAAAAHAPTLDKAPEPGERTQTPMPASEPSPPATEARAATAEPIASRPRRRWLLVGAAGLPVLGVAGWLIAHGGDKQPAPAPAPAAAPAAPAPPPAPTEVKIRFSSTPTGATVRVDGSPKVLGTTPFTATFPRAPDRTLKLVFEKAGFVDADQQVALDGDGSVTAALAAAPPVAVAPPPTKPKPPRTAAKPPATQPTNKPPAKKLDHGATMDVFGGN